MYVVFDGPDVQFDTDLQAACLCEAPFFLNATSFAATLLARAPREVVMKTGMLFQAASAFFTAFESPVPADDEVEMLEYKHFLATGRCFVDEHCWREDPLVLFWNNV